MLSKILSWLVTVATPPPGVLVKVDKQRYQNERKCSHVENGQQCDQWGAKWMGGLWCNKWAAIVDDHGLTWGGGVLFGRHKPCDIAHTYNEKTMVGVFALRDIHPGERLVNYRDYAECLTEAEWKAKWKKRRFWKVSTEAWNKAMTVCGVGTRLLIVSVLL